MIDISVLPESIREWIKSLGPVKDIRDVEIVRDCVALESDGGWKSYIPNGYLKVKVIVPPLEHCCSFAQIHPGEWAHVNENTDIAYIGNCEIKLEKKRIK